MIIFGGKKKIQENEEKKNILCIRCKGVKKVVVEY
jgi:hypothetical protein